MLKVLHVGWWTLEYRKAGGSIIHVETLMEYLHRHRCENVYFCGGRYNPFARSVYLKQWEKPYTKVYELVNSPNIVGCYESTPMHIQCEPIEKLFLRVLETEKPDIIHFHELESLTGSLLTIARSKKVPVVVGIHNYWYLCPQRDMMNINKEACEDFQNGEKCASCIVITNNSRFGKIYGMYGGYFRNTPIGKLIDPIVIKFYGLLNKWCYPLLNTVEPKKLPASLFLRRRQLFANELNNVQAIIFPSKRVKEIYRRHQVINENSIVMPPININYLQIQPKNHFLHPVVPSKITFGYVGSILKTKGVHVIIDAVSMLEHYKDRFQVFIFGGGDELYISQLKVKASGSNIEFKGRYSPDEIQKVLFSIDVGIVPSIWEDCAPIVLNELRLSKTPIIASRIGGIPEAVEHGVNGFLFEPGNAEELAKYMKFFIENPQEIPKFMERTNWSFDIDKYAEETIEIYKKAIEQSSGN